MSCPPEMKPPVKPSADIDPCSILAHFDFGLSKDELEEVARSMEAVVRRVGCRGHIHPLEVVHDAFVTASYKPISERPAITERKKFVAWMCTLAEFAALSNRKSKHRRLLGEGHSETEMGVLLSTSSHAESVAAREALRKAFTKVDAEDQALVVARHIEGKTITEIAQEQGLPRSTVDSRYARAMGILRTALKALLAAIALLFPKSARAQGARLGLRASRFFAQVTHTASAMTVTIAFGVIVPTNLVTTTNVEQSGLASEQASSTAMVAPVYVPEKPPEDVEVDPVKPIAVDESAAQWSAADMNSTRIVSYLQGTLLPFAFLVTPVVTQVACAGAERQTPPVQEPDERDDSTDPYDIMCEAERLRGNDCPSRAEWYGEMGLCPDGTKNCQR